MLPRILLYSLLLLSLTAWAYSTFHTTYLTWTRPQSAWMIQLHRGQLRIFQTADADPPYGITFARCRTIYLPDADRSGLSLLGFSIGEIEASDYMACLFIGIPLWFIAALSTTALYLIWKKDRATPKPAFPLHPDTPRD